MFTKFNTHLIFLFIILGFSGCGFMPLNSSENKQLSENHKQITRTHTKFNFSGKNQNKTKSDEVKSIAKRPFIGMAFSGGGSRSANFAAGILRNLEMVELPYTNGKVNFDLNNTVSAFSSVSGGGLTAAYYSLYSNCKPTNESSNCKKQGNEESKIWWNKLEKKLRINFIAHWFFNKFLPHTFIRYWWTDFDRSNIMANILNDKLFDGSKFIALENSNGPKLYINATNLSGKVVNEHSHYKRRVLPFTFTDDNFGKKLNSELSSYPIANAVMASAAFPAVFHNVSLKNYTTGYENQYAHFFDGGPSDNLGIITLLETYSKNKYQQSEDSNSQTINPGGFDSCFLFVVDASDTGLYDWNVTGKDLPPEYIRKFGNNKEQINKTKKSYKDINEGIIQIRDFLKFQDEENKIHEDSRVFQSDTREATDFFIDSNVLDATDRMLMNIRIRNLLQLGIDVRKTHVKPWGDGSLREVYTGVKESGVDCRAWHFSFNRLLGLILKELQISNFDKAKYYYQLWRTVTDIPTSFNLSSEVRFKNDVTECPKNDPERAQCALLKTAEILVKDAEDSFNNEINYFMVDKNVIPKNVYDDSLIWFKKNFNPNWNPNINN